MLLQKIANTKKLIDKYKNEEAHENQIQHFQTSRDMLESKKGNFDSLSSSYRVLHSHESDKFIYSLDKALPDGLVALLRDLQGKGTPPSTFKILGVFQKASPWEEALKANWTGYVDKKCREVLDTLHAMRSILDNTAEIDQVISAAGRLGNAWPVRDANIRQVEDVTIKGRKIISDLNAGLEIQDFLKKVAGGRAVVSDINPTVREWLSQQGLDIRLEVSFRRR